MLWIVQRGISSSITQEYGDTTISTNFGLWPSGWQDGSKVQSFQTNLQKNFHSLMNAWIYPSFIVMEHLL